MGGVGQPAFFAGLPEKPKDPKQKAFDQIVDKLT
jgi:hypothetical protein